jgi:hydrogenase nickel incorporation protein HypA/HybF
VEADLLVEAFAAARAGTCARGAELIVERTPVRVRCLECAKESEAAPSVLACTGCGSARTQLLGGDELLLTRFDVMEAGAAMRRPVATSG